MKIKLEQTMISCPERLTCVVCQKFFAVGKIRQLLQDHRSLLQGDICPACVRRSTAEIQQILTVHGLERMLSDNPRDQERGQELLAIAQEPLQFPSLWQRLLKKIEILATETSALEQARFQTTPAPQHCRRLQSLEYIYEKSDNR